MYSLLGDVCASEDGSSGFSRVTTKERHNYRRKGIAHAVC